MKPVLTIFLSLFFFHSFAQDDSLLQRLIDSAKTAGPTVAKPVVVKKDSAKPLAPPPLAIKADSAKTSTNAAQHLTVTDSLLTVNTDTTAKESITAPVQVAVVKHLSWQQDTAFMHLLMIPYNVKKDVEPLRREGDLRERENKDYLFYTLVGVVLLLAFIKQLFPKYFANLFRLLFEASFRQKQRREQLMQETLASLMMNILFIIVAGLFIALLAVYYGWLQTSFWLLALYCITVLAAIYLLKYVVIQFTGWVFNAGEPAATYSFIVFLVNKIAGVALLPLLLLSAFSSGQVWDMSITIAAATVCLLLLFRYIISLSLLRGMLNINPFHFFIYLCTVEIMPMLVIYKVIFNFTGKSN